jgi:hypothetical protein
MTSRASADDKNIHVEQVPLIRISSGKIFSAGFVDKSGRSKNSCSSDLVFEVFATIHGDGLVGRLGFQENTV